jgi:ABC transport system ATP-binding/permease protein
MAKQTLTYLLRDLRSKIANRQYMMLTLLEGPLLGLILSYIIRYIADPSSAYTSSGKMRISRYTFS